jgi:hypothetical protein
MTLPLRVGYVALGAALIVAAAFTTPFTTGAEAVTAIPIIIGLVILIGKLRAHPSLTAPAPPRAAPRTYVWLILALTTLAWELYCYLATPRAAHPTLSVLIDQLTSTPFGRAMAFLLWLVLGWYVIAT